MNFTERLDVDRIERTARKFRIICHPERTRMILMLEEHKEMNVTEIYEKMEMNQPEASHHLTLMLDYGILTKVRRGKMSIYSVNHDVIEKILKYTELLARWA
jgi:ArsR family transcriptional regulator